MAKGKRKKWITAQIAEPVTLEKSGIKIVVWDKRGKSCRGTAIVSAEGIRWNGFKTKKRVHIPWKEFQDFAEK
jgi:hypothetical protein